MEIAKTVKNTRDTRKAQMLESYFHKKVFEFGNNELASEMGIHPSKLSKDKNRIARLASLMIVNLGLPEWAFEIFDADSKPVVVIEGIYAERLIQALESEGKVKRKTSKAATNEASEMQIEMSI
ncbi:transcriptional regulator [Xenorhabdus stockiae]|uniref:Transcriptional regulator n=1 Tax=Xenorhabdus stockiae TaxID=351614 RepID=A0A2D0KVW0_9GAMM|nr:hypothetical protein [Xenorhabdus stockiae]PHM67542.1 transcriptional regulator [Xenorhabdus stockiae]